MYIFKESEKKKVLQGRTLKYLCEEKLYVTQGYLSQVLSGKRGCSIRFAQDIVECISSDAKIEDYFVKKGE